MQLNDFEPNLARELNRTVDKPLTIVVRLDENNFSTNGDWSIRQAAALSALSEKVQALGGSVVGSSGALYHKVTLPRSAEALNDLLNLDVVHSLRLDVGLMGV